MREAVSKSSLKEVLNFHKPCRQVVWYVIYVEEVVRLFVFVLFDSIDDNHVHTCPLVPQIWKRIWRNFSVYLAVIFLLLYNFKNSLEGALSAKVIKFHQNFQQGLQPFVFFTFGTL